VARKNLLIVPPRIVFRLDINKTRTVRSKCPGSGRNGHDVSVHEPCARWPGREPVAQVAMGRDRQALLLFGAGPTSAGMTSPCQCTSSAESVSLNRSNRRRDALPQPDHRPGTAPLYPIVLMVWFLGDIHQRRTDAVAWTSAGPLGTLAVPPVSPARWQPAQQKARGRS